ncbi:MAG TPA: tRNA pseudouridine(38-40) synthase TruA [Bacteroidaceae bacterium]|nr:tRNA pseudouridine(38-40) synthase TruA [Bacteroidaceae bacterium]
MRYFIYFCYDGAAYNGWQKQPGLPTIQKIMEDSLSKFLRVEAKLTGAGRTDAGVHAKEMVAHIDLSDNTDCEWVKNRLNRMLPSDISIHKIIPVADNAHARFDALSRTYKYYVSLNKLPFKRHYSCKLTAIPNFEIMNRAALLLLSTSDFDSFSKSHSNTKTKVCKVLAAEWSKISNDEWVFTITADRFLRNMVRAIVGTLLKTGYNRLSVDEFESVIKKKDRCAAGESVPPHGLFLESIEYPEHIFIKNRSL